VEQGSDDAGLPVEQRHSGPRPADAPLSPGTRRRRVLVVFIGGVTCAEVGPSPVAASASLLGAFHAAGARPCAGQ
jgi:hypothetical protein